MGVAQGAVSPGDHPTSRHRSAQPVAQLRSMSSGSGIGQRPQEGKPPPQEGGPPAVVDQPTPSPQRPPQPLENKEAEAPPQAKEEEEAKAQEELTR